MASIAARFLVTFQNIQLFKPSREGTPWRPLFLFFFFLFFFFPCSIFPFFLFFHFSHFLFSFSFSILGCSKSDDIFVGLDCFTISYNIFGCGLFSFFLLFFMFFIFYFAIFVFFLKNEFLFFQIYAAPSICISVSSVVGAPWRCGVLTTLGGMAGIGLGRLLGGEHDSISQSGVGTPRLLKKEASPDCIIVVVAAAAPVAVAVAVSLSVAVVWDTV